MSSLKMTFSLASLVVLMAFIAMPVMAHDGHDDPHPIVTITKAPASVYTAPAKAMRNDFKVKISVALDGSTDITQFASDTELVADDIMVTGRDRTGRSIVATYTVSTQDDITQPDDTKAEWILEIDLTANGIGPTAKSITVKVNPDAVVADQPNSDEDNLGKIICFCGFANYIRSDSRRDSCCSGNHACYE